MRCVLNSDQFVCKNPINFNIIFSNVFNFVIMPYSGSMEVIFAQISMDYSKYSIIMWLIINLSNFVAFINYLIYSIFSKSAFAAVCYMLTVLTKVLLQCKLHPFSTCIMLCFHHSDDSSGSYRYHSLFGALEKMLLEFRVCKNCCTLNPP